MVTGKRTLPDHFQRHGDEEIGVSQGFKMAGEPCRESLAADQCADFDVPLLAADHVTADTGTGFVHTAPGHGQEDFEVGQKYSLDTLCPVDSRGRFMEGNGELTGAASPGPGACVGSGAPRVPRSNVTETSAARPTAAAASAAERQPATAAMPAVGPLYGTWSASRPMEPR